MTIKSIRGWALERACDIDLTVCLVAMIMKPTDLRPSSYKY